MRKDEILAALPTLTRADLEALQAVVSSLLGGHMGGFSGAGGTLPALLFDALSGHLNAVAAWSFVAGTKHGKLLVKNAPGVGKFLDRHFNGWDGNKIKQLAFLRLLIGLLADDLKERGVQPTFGIMVVNLNRLPDVVENAFPSYLESGLGPELLKRLTQRVD